MKRLKLKLGFLRLISPSIRQQLARKNLAKNSSEKSLKSRKWWQLTVQPLNVDCHPISSFRYSTVGRLDERMDEKSFQPRLSRFQGFWPTQEIDEQSPKANVWCVFGYQSWPVVGLVSTTTQVGSQKLNRYEQNQRTKNAPKLCVTLHKILKKNLKS